MRVFDVTTCVALFVLSAFHAAPAAADGPAMIQGAQRYVFVDQTACVCGHFPDEKSRRGLLLGGVPVGEPSTASRSMVEFRVPEGISPGLHAVTGSPTAGFETVDGPQIAVLGLEGSIDLELLHSGQSTPMRIRIAGTEDRLELRLINTTPQIISIEGGDEGLVWTSGGADNTVERTVRGLRPGDFNIAYEVANDACPCAPEGAGGASGENAPASPPVERGYPLPEGVTVVGKPTGTGLTTGHIADVTIENAGPGPIVFPDRAIYIPSDGKYQPYVVPGGRGTAVPPGATRTVPIDGYCGDVNRPPVPAGGDFQGLAEWIVPVDPTRTGRTVERPPTGVVDPDTDPETAAPYLWGAVEAIEETVDELQGGGKLSTPFSSNREREREAVVQQTLWIYAGELTGRPYTREQFEGRLEQQYENRTGTPIASAPAEDRERLEQGADDFWDAFELVGAEAKVLVSDDEVPVTTPEGATEDVVEKPPCDIAKTMKHSEPASDFKMSENYKDEDKRDGLEKWFSDLPDPASTPEGGTFEAGTYPASAWALAGRDFIGGYCNAVTNRLFLEGDGSQDMVWSTELLEVEARSDGSHTVTVKPPAGGACDTLVVGAAGGVVEAWSNGVDPIANSRDFLTVLRVVRDVSIIVASAVLAPVTAGASIAVGVVTLGATMAFDSAFSSDADAAAAVEGRVRLRVKRSEINLNANSRSSVTNDGDIESDGSKVAYGKTSADDPTTITATFEGFSTLKTKAEDNGIAEGTIESQIGIAIVGFCYCDGGIQIEYLLDSGLFLAERGAAGAAISARVNLEKRLNEVLEKYAEMAPEEVIPSARDDLGEELEEMLEGWYGENASRFNLPSD